MRVEDINESDTRVLSNDTTYNWVPFSSHIDLGLYVPIALPKFHINNKTPTGLTKSLRLKMYYWL